MPVRRLAKSALAAMTVAGCLAAVPATAAVQKICFATSDGFKHFELMLDPTVNIQTVAGFSYLTGFSPGCAGVSVWPLTGTLLRVSPVAFWLGFHESNVDSVSKGDCGGIEYFISSTGTSPNKLNEFNPALGKFFGPFAVNFEACVF